MIRDEKYETVASDRGNSVVRVLATVFVIAAMILAMGISYQLLVDRHVPSPMVKATPAEMGLQAVARVKAIEFAFKKAQVHLNMDYANRLLSGGDLSTWAISKTGLVLDDFEVNLSGTFGTGEVTILVTGGPAWVGSVPAPGRTMHATACE